MEIISELGGVKKLCLNSLIKSYTQKRIENVTCLLGTSEYHRVHITVPTAEILSGKFSPKLGWIGCAI